MSTRIDYLNPAGPTGGTASFWYTIGWIENIITNNLLTPPAKDELIKQMSMFACIPEAEARKRFDELCPQLKIEEIEIVDITASKFSGYSKNSYSIHSKESYFNACKIWASSRHRYKNMEDFIRTYFGMENGILEVGVSTFKKYLGDAYKAGIIHKDNKGRFIP